MRRAASATLVRLSRQASRDLAGPPREELGPALSGLVAAEEARTQGGQPKRSRRFGAHLAAALHLASVQQAGAMDAQPRAVRSEGALFPALAPCPLPSALLECPAAHCLQHLHLHERDHSQRPVGIQRSGSVRDPEMHPHKCGGGEGGSGSAAAGGWARAQLRAARPCLMAPPIAAHAWCRHHSHRAPWLRAFVLVGVGSARWQTLP